MVTEFDTFTNVAAPGRRGARGTRPRPCGRHRPRRHCGSSSFVSTVSPPLDNRARLEGERGHDPLCCVFQELFVVRSDAAIPPSTVCTSAIVSWPPAFSFTLDNAIGGPHVLAVSATRTIFSTRSSWSIQSIDFNCTG
jgi:hypothetical protein